MRKILSLLFSLFLLSATAQELSLIPQPAKVEVKEGNFSFCDGMVLSYPKVADEEDRKYILEYLSDISLAYNTKLILDDFNHIKVEF